MDGVQLEQVSDFEYLGCLLDELVADVKCHRKVVNGRKFANTISFLVHARVLHEGLLVPVLLYGSETMIEKRRGLELGLRRWATLKV